MMTAPQQHTDEIKRDLQATLSARRELGTEYDDQFLDALAEKLTAQARQEVANAQRAPQPSNKLSRDQRTGVAICSLIFGIPILGIALGGGVFAPLFFLVAVAMLVLLNIIAAR